MLGRRCFNMESVLSGDIYLLLKRSSTSPVCRRGLLSSSSRRVREAVDRVPRRGGGENTWFRLGPVQCAPRNWTRKSVYQKRLFQSTQLVLIIAYCSMAKESEQYEVLVLSGYIPGMA